VTYDHWKNKKLEMYDFTAYLQTICSLYLFVSKFAEIDDLFIS